MANKNSSGSRVRVTRFSKRVVVFCIAFIVVYTVAQVVLSYMLQVELSPTLTTSVYAFFGTELCMCALTKFCDSISESKGKHNKDKEVNDSVG